MHPSSPQAKEMADESMVRNLAAQAEAIWPQEEPIFAAASAGTAHVLDVGCGTGEITARLAATFPGRDRSSASIWRSRISRARARAAPSSANASASRSATRWRCRSRTRRSTTSSAGTCMQAVPDAARVLAARSGACSVPADALHVIAEDYGMLLCHPTESRLGRLLAAASRRATPPASAAICTSAARRSRSSTTSA